MRASHRSRRRGQAMVETALAFTIFLTVVFGLIEFSQAVWTYTLLSHAARAGTRYASVRGASSKTPASASDVQTVVKAQAVGLDPNKMTVTVTWLPDNSVGSPVKVLVKYTFGFLGPYMPAKTIAMQSTSQVIVSN